MKFKNVDDKHKYDRKAQKIMFFTSIIMIVPTFFLFVLQVTRGVFSMFSLIPTIIAVVIGVNAIRMAFSGNKKKDEGLYYAENVEDEEARREREEQEKIAGTLLDVFTPLSKRSKILRFVFGLFLVLAGCAMFCIAPTTAKTDVNLTAVTATVINQVDRTTYEYDRDSDGDTTVTEHRACDVTVKYVFNGEEKTQTIRLEGASYVYSKDFDIYLDESGKFVKSVASTQTFNWVGGIFVLTGVLLFISLYFSISDVVYVAAIMLLIGGSLAFILGLKVSFVDMLISDLTTFCSLFVSIALYMFLSFILIAAQFPKEITEMVTWEKYRPKRSPRLDQDFSARVRVNGTSYQVPNTHINDQHYNRFGQPYNMYENETQRKLKEGEQVIVGRVDENNQSDNMNYNSNFDNNDSNFN